MRTHMMIIRAMTAAVLFVMLTKANVWADTQTHLVLAVGYRAFLVGAPLFLFLGLNHGMRLALALCLLGTLGTIVSVNAFTLGILALGMAVSGYLAKFVATHTTRGAADNKVSLNIGSLLSGLILMVMTDSLSIKLLSCACLALAILLAFKVDWSKQMDHVPDHAQKSQAKRKFKLRPYLGWGFIGVATGIKLTGIFAIMPQYLMLKTGVLPPWFGSLIIFNSVMVIVMQHQVLSLLDRFPHYLTVLLSLSAMVVLALPSVMGVENPFLAIFWVLLLTVGECALSQYDRIAKEEGYLFPKELMVGVGSLITVSLSRSWTQDIYWSGLAGALCLVAGTLVLWQKTPSHGPVA